MTVDRPISEDDLQAYVDGALDPERRASVARYLEEHPEAARRVEAYRRQRADLRAALAPIAEEPLPPNLNLDRLIEARRQSRLAPWRVVAAAIVLLAFGGASGWLLRGNLSGPESGVAALAQEAADSYTVYGPDQVQPVELRAEASDRLVDWISQRLNRAVAVPDLSASGYRFMGGRLVPTPHGPAGLFMYDNNHGLRLVMLVRPMASERDTPMSEQRRGEVAGFAWADKGLGFSLVGPAPPQDLHPLADEIRRQMAKSI